MSWRLLRWHVCIQKWRLTTTSSIHVFCVLYRHAPRSMMKQTVFALVLLGLDPKPWIFAHQQSAGSFKILTTGEASFVSREIFFPTFLDQLPAPSFRKIAEDLVFQRSLEKLQTFQQNAVKAKQEMAKESGLETACQILEDVFSS